MSNINKEHPLPDTCKELGLKFPEWITQYRFYQINESMQRIDTEFKPFVSGYKLLQKGDKFVPYSIAPTYTELWEKLVEMNEKYTEVEGELVVSYYEYKQFRLYLDYQNWAYDNHFGFTIPIHDNHVTEALAQLILKLKDNE